MNGMDRDSRDKLLGKTIKWFEDRPLVVGAWTQYGALALSETTIEFTDGTEVTTGRFNVGELSLKYPETSAKDALAETLGRIKRTLPARNSVGKLSMSNTNYDLLHSDVDYLLKMVEYGVFGIICKEPDVSVGGEVTQTVGDDVRNNLAKALGMLSEHSLGSAWKLIQDSINTLNSVLDKPQESQPEKPVQSSIPSVKSESAHYPRTVEITLPVSCDVLFWDSGKSYRVVEVLESGLWVKPGRKSERVDPQDQSDEKKRVAVETGHGQEVRIVDRAVPAPMDLDTKPLTAKTHIYPEFQGIDSGDRVQFNQPLEPVYLGKDSKVHPLRPAVPIGMVEMQEYLMSSTIAQGIQRGPTIGAERDEIARNIRNSMRLLRFTLFGWLMLNGVKIPVALMNDGSHPEVGDQLPDQQEKKQFVK